jgi:hypothetical protein
MSNRRRKRDTEGFGLSFLDVICCGFGAIVLLLIISKIGPQDAEPRRSDQNLQATLFSLNDEIASTEVEFTKARDLLLDLQADRDRLIGQLQSARDDLSTAGSISSTLSQESDRLETAQSRVSEEMKKANPTNKRDPAVGGIPVDSEYIIFVIDTSGSMKYMWDRVVQEVDNILTIHPQVKGLQIMNDMGVYMFKEYRGKWIPDTPGRRNAIRMRMNDWNANSNSSPVEGISAAIRRHFKTGQKISIFTMGDEFTGISITNVLHQIERENKTGKDGSSRVRIHAIGFPTILRAQAAERYSSTARFANLMRLMSNANRGTFLALGR